MVEKTPGPSIRVPPNEKVCQKKPAHPEMEFQYESLAESVIPVQQFDRGNNNNCQTTQQYKSVEYLLENFTSFHRKWVYKVHKEGVQKVLSSIYKLPPLTPPYSYGLNK